MSDQPVHHCELCGSPVVVAGGEPGPGGTRRYLRVEDICQIAALAQSQRIAPYTLASDVARVLLAEIERIARGEEAPDAR